MAKDALGLVGHTLDGQYRLEKPVGEGGFSVVYKATHLGLEEPVAVKCLKLASALDAEAAESFARRFRDEGRILYKLSQGNLDIVRCTTSTTTRSPKTGGLLPYMVLEWLEGRALMADLVDRRKLGMRGRSLHEAIELLEPAALALQHAHVQAVVHRDVKPANLFLVKSRTGAPRIKVLDFGLAKLIDDQMGITMKSTRGNLMMCSPRYAAPEQFNTQLAPIGPWTDVYSLGLVILEVLRDERVRQGEGMAACLLEATDPKVKLRASDLGIRVPRAVEDVLARAVAVDAKTRPRNAGELWSELVAAAGPPPSQPEVEPEPPDSSRTLVDPTMPLSRDMLDGAPAPTVVMKRAEVPLQSRPRPAAGAPARAIAPTVRPAAPSRPELGAPRAPHPSAPSVSAHRAPQPSASNLAPHRAPAHSAPAHAPLRAQPVPSAPGSSPVFVPPPSASSGRLPIPADDAASRQRTRLLVVVLLVTLFGAAAGFVAWRFWHARHAHPAALSSPSR